jgi:hypothetical protein
MRRCEVTAGARLFVYIVHMAYFHDGFQACLGPNYLHIERDEGEKCILILKIEVK